LGHLDDGLALIEQARAQRSRQAAATEAAALRRGRQEGRPPGKAAAPGSACFARAELPRH
jgi:hypothetical protein